MHPEPPRFPPLPVLLFTLLLLSAVTVLGDWLSGGICAVLALLLLPGTAGYSRGGGVPRSSGPGSSGSASG